jgi:predicted nucleic acid-binding protein
MDFVLDASVALAWVFPDEGTAYALRIREHLKSQTPVVPALWSLELANVLALALKRRRINQSTFDDALALLESIPAQVDELTFRSAWGPTLRLAIEHGLNAYDAAYLEVAHRRHLPLATLDEDLRRVAKRANVKLL